MRISDWSSDVCSSDLRADVVSPAGARGLMQLMPGTAAQIARRKGEPLGSLNDPRTNIEYGQYYLEELRDFSRSEEHTSELQSLMRISYDVFCLKKKTQIYTTQQ